MSDSISSTLQEHRLFPPPEDFVSRNGPRSLDEYRAMHRESIDNPEAFFGKVAAELQWSRPWTRVLNWQVPDARWFEGGQTNLSVNCLDRHIAAGRGDTTAIVFEGEPVDASGKPTEVRTYTYKQLLAEVCRLAGALTALGVAKGSCVTIYLPMTAEAVIAMLACARIGAIHSVIFGGFSSQAIADRVTDARSRFVITADGGFRRGTFIHLKAQVDAALSTCGGQVEKVVVLRRTGQPVDMVAGRDVWWHEAVANQPATFPAEQMHAEDPLFVLYTSGSTGKPKGILHTTGGYMVGAYLTAKHVFDLTPGEIYWCTADVGWITGHTYVTYGPLLNGATLVIYEGAPNYPDYSRFWSIIERHKVSVFYTAPTAIRAFMKAGRQLVDNHNLSSLRLLGSVGEPINPEAWMWYHQVIGHGRCPIVDTWWQTETGSILISPLPAATPTKPGTATLPFFGVDAAVVDRSGAELPANHGGMLVVRRPWPSMLRGIFNDPARYQKQYWTDVPGMYFTGDSARRDADGYFWIMGRMDDVLKISGHRLGTAEIESAIVSHPAVAEAAVVGTPHEIKGEGVAAFVTLRTGQKASDGLKKELSEVVVKQIGALARPDQIRFTDSLPKTRSGKIMRRLLREIASGAEVKGDTSTLEDFSVLARLRDTEE